jgi:hypothetical protein
MLAIQRLLNVVLSQIHPGRTTVDHRAQCQTMGLSPGGHAKHFAKGISRHKTFSRYRFPMNLFFNFLISDTMPALNKC